MSITPDYRLIGNRKRSLSDDKAHQSSQLFAPEAARNIFQQSTSFPTGKSTHTRRGNWNLRKRLPCPNNGRATFRGVHIDSGNEAASSVDFGGFYQRRRWAIKTGLTYKEVIHVLRAALGVFFSRSLGN